MPVVGIAMSATALVGHDLGRGDFEEAGKKADAISKISLYMVVIISIITALASGWIPQLFKFSSEGKSLAANSILILSFFQVFYIYNICYPNILRAGGDTKIIIYISGSAMWFFGLPLAYLFGVILNYGLYGVVVGNGIGEIIKAFLFRKRYKRGAWRKKLV